MPRIEYTIWCDNCGVEILDCPIIDGKHFFCCQDCREGRPCGCGDRTELEDEYRENPLPFASLLHS
jgi:hypothetical protein